MTSRCYACDDATDAEFGMSFASHCRVINTEHLFSLCDDCAATLGVLAPVDFGQHYYDTEDYTEYTYLALPRQ